MGTEACASEEGFLDDTPAHHPSSFPLAALRLMRPGDWLKNIFVFVPAIFYYAGVAREQLAQWAAGATADGSLVQSHLSALAAGFGAFCLLASGAYAINDAIDAPEDRLHPVKSRRSVASGALTPAAAIWIGIACVAGGLALATAAGPDGLGIVLVYALIQFVYNLGLKRVAFVDVSCLATGFCLRAILGATAIGAPISVWLLVCVFFLTLYLGFIKRTCDMVRASQSPGSTWRSRAGYADRFELEWLLGISGVLTALSYLSYTLSAHARGIFGVRALGLALLTPLVLMVVHRFYRRATAGRSESPLAALLEDRIVLAGIACFVAGMMAVLFWSPLELWLARVLAA